MRMPVTIGLVLAAAVAVAERSGPPVDIEFLDARGALRQGVRCAAPRSTRRAADTVARELEAAGSLVAGDGGVVSVPVWFHVVYTRKGRTIEGDVSDGAIAQQLATLNDAFAGSGFVFHLAGIDRTQNNRWFTGCYGIDAELEMKQALAVDPARVLNVYTCEPQQGILGYAYVPWSLAEDDVRQGVVVLYGTLPGGYAYPYDEGDTVVHEVGHYLGLEHTFTDGCSEPGDHVADTPPEARPAYGCPHGRDTCQGGGVDPIYNFMDYSDDACMDEFTPGQTERVHAVTALYRPSLQCGNDVCDAGEACVCADDCGAAPATETQCADGIDDDCDGAVDGADPDCGAAGCGAVGEPCTVDADCCSGSCKGRPGRGSCK